MQNEPPMVPEKTKKSKNTDKNLLNLQATTAAAAAAAAANSSSNSKQPMTFDINLPNAPLNETHPLMVGIRRPSSTVAASSNANSNLGSSISGLGSSMKNSKI